MDRFTLLLAGVRLGVTALFDSTRAYFGDYLTELAPQEQLTVTPEALVLEQQWLDAEAQREGLRRRVFTGPFLERNHLQRQAARLLKHRDILLLHGSAVALEGKGYLFLAPCGTGKSTHARFWRQQLGAVSVNDDKPLVALTEHGALLCGSPWTGKHGLGQNLTVPLKGICLLERGVQTCVTPLAPEAALPRLLPLVGGAEEADALLHTLAGRLCRQVPVWLLRCTPTPEAATVCHQSIG